MWAGSAVGGCNPIVIQSMTNTDTADVTATVSQTDALARAGSELVRVTVNSKEAAAAVPEIVRRLGEGGIDVPIIGDFHYNGHILLREFPDCAKALAKYRINPGNVGMGRGQDDNFRTIIEVANANDKRVRIGVNWGVPGSKAGHAPDGRERAAGRTEGRRRGHPGGDGRQRAAIGRDGDCIGMERERIILSAKVSRVRDLVHVYRELASKTECACTSD